MGHASSGSPVGELLHSCAPSAGSLADSFDFVLRNFTEMNRLWVRMKRNEQPLEEDDVRTELLELRLLFGSNFATLGRLLASDIRLYTTKVLPALIEQIVTCRDAIAQEYLADCGALGRLSARVARCVSDDVRAARAQRQAADGACGDYDSCCEGGGGK